MTSFFLPIRKTPQPHKGFYMIKLISLLCCFLYGGAMANKIDLYSESYGDSKNPCILLNAGAGQQYFFWPETFCKDLADKGYFVIRYDYRDTGLSPAINFNSSPYNAFDLANDTLNLLEKYNVQKATYVGFSMGAQVAMITAATYPDKVDRLILLGASPTFKPGFDAFGGLAHTEQLSPPDPNYVKWIKDQTPAVTREDKINHYINLWQILDGTAPDFAVQYFLTHAVLELDRSPIQDAYSRHEKSMKLSYGIHAEAINHIDCPTLIIQGSKDPVFPLDHGQFLKQHIKKASLEVWTNLAHAPFPRNSKEIAVAIDEFIREERP